MEIEQMIDDEIDKGNRRLAISNQQPAVKVTRRERLYAKLCWPEIDTQRTRFCVTPAPAYYLPVPPRQQSDLFEVEEISIDKWVYHGKRRHLVARWGYSPRLDTVVIREVRTAHNWAIDCATCAKEALSDGD
jgi:hypothetical protein